MYHQQTNLVIFINIFIFKILLLILHKGLVLSANAVSMYAKYPQRLQSVYIKLKGLAMGTYGGLNNWILWIIKDTDNVLW